MPDSIRQQEVLHEPRPRPPRHCGTCGRATADGKTYCPKHVLEEPYAAGVVRQLEARDAEVREVLRRGAPGVPRDSIVLADLLVLLANLGQATADGLSFHYHAELAAAGGRVERRRVLAAYLRALERRGLVRLSHGRRGAQVVTLVLPEAASA